VFTRERLCSRPLAAFDSLYDRSMLLSCNEGRWLCLLEIRNTEN
jgi:hypothetical protein